MEINLNLLPQSKKEEMIRMRHFRSAIGWEILFSLIIIVLAAFLFGIYLVLSLNYDMLAKFQNAESEKAQYKAINQYEDEFERINAKMALVTKVRNDQLYWSDFLLRLNNLIDPGIELDGIATKEYAVFLVGKASDRDSLIALKEKLEKDECFSEVNLPLSNLTVKENIDFQIDLKINDQCLKKK